MNGLNDREKIVLKQYLQSVGDKFEEIINDMVEANPGQNPQALGLFISYAFSEEIKELQKPDLCTIGLSEDELNEVIESMAQEVLTKFMKKGKPTSKRNEFTNNKGCSVLLASIAIIVSICFVLFTL